jgi:hypothetical protein
MFYMNFDDNITDKHGIIVKNWPLPFFCAPGDIRTVTELKILYNAWESGTAHFYQMTMAEATKWYNERHSAMSTSSSSMPLAGDSSKEADPAENNTDATVNPSEQASPTDPAENNTDATVNPSEQASPMDPAENNTDATVNPSEQANPSPTDPSEQATIANASVSSLPTANHNPSSSTATASSRKRAQATEAQPSPPNKRRRQGVTSAFINTVITSVDGATVVMSKKPRKERSDKGKKRAK